MPEQPVADIDVTCAVLLLNPFSPVQVVTYPVRFPLPLSFPFAWVFRVVFLASAEKPKDHSHGHRHNATMVMEVSRQFDRVLVEQNHCHGLTTANAS